MFLSDEEWAIRKVGEKLKNSPENVGSRVDKWIWDLGSDQNEM
jgi:hypothetical protein